MIFINSLKQFVTKQKYFIQKNSIFLFFKTQIISKRRNNNIQMLNLIKSLQSNSQNYKKSFVSENKLNQKTIDEDHKHNKTNQNSQQMQFLNVNSLNNPNRTSSTSGFNQSNQSNIFKNLFKNSSIIKQQFLVSKFYEVITGAQKKFKPQIKVRPVVLVNKLHQSRPLSKNSIIYKQIAYDVQLQPQINKPYKIKDCISSARPNSQTYKRINKEFFLNIKKGVDQCMLFVGSESAARIQSSIGNQNNPGLFMIMAVAILDQKYKQNHERFDVQFSFLEYRNQKMYDLINYTQIPLQPKYKDHNSPNFNHKKSSAPYFCQHRVKVNTFLQFIKLFKVALFNNKQRDFRTNSSNKSSLNYHCQQFLSTFIMKVRIKKYNVQNQLIFEQESVLIDFEQNSSGRMKKQDQTDENTVSKNKLSSQFAKTQKQKNSFLTSQSTQAFDQNEKTKDDNKSAGKTLLDYLLIQINNSNPNNKNIHYHMVEKNLLLQVVKRYLRVKSSSNKDQENQRKHHFTQLKAAKEQNRVSSNILKNYLAKQEPKFIQVGGQLFLINSLTSNPNLYNQTVKYYQNIRQSIGLQIQAIYHNKNKFNTFFDTLYTSKILKKVVDSVKTRKYQSLRNLYIAKQFYSKQSKKLISSIKQYKTILSEYISIKRNLKYSQNLFAGYQLQLIGNCIKSDNFKDFYTSKSFLSLPRQIQIKTSTNKSEIINFIHGLKQIQERYVLMEKKVKMSIKSYNQVPIFLQKSVNIEENNSQSSSIKQQKYKSQLFDSQIASKKFKLLQQNTKFQEKIFEQFDDLQEFFSLRQYIYDYFHEVWNKVYLQECERTITQQILYEEFLNQEIIQIVQQFNDFILKISQIDDSDIKCCKDEKLLTMKGFTQLLRSINQSKKGILKYEPKNKGKLPLKIKDMRQKSSYKKQNLYQTTTYLPKITQKQHLPIIKNKSLSNTDKKKSKHVQVFEISGKVDFGNFLLNPYKES